MIAYYNDSEPFVAQWLRNLIAAGKITPGDVDERPIQEVTADDVRGYDRCHFFAGIGGWELALNLAGWTGPVWTGSCPCQPFSVAGKGAGEADVRHLWPAFHRLIAECRPATVFGEQVASPDGLQWLAGVRLDLEGSGYAVGAADLPAASVGAPHIRQRLWWVADSGGRGTIPAAKGDNSYRETPRRNEGNGVLEPCGTDGRLGDSAGRWQRQRQSGASGGRQGALGGSGARLADADGKGQARERETQHCSPERSRSTDRDRQMGSRLGNADGTRPQRRGEYAGEHADQWAAWATSEPVACYDGRTRRVGSGVQPLANGIPNRVGKLRGFGNAIVPAVAAVFVRAFMECAP